MDLPWGDEKTHQFITNVGLITSDGPIGPNIMSAEWTHQISYSPGLIAVYIGPHKATATNIRQTKEFGVNLSSIEQAKVAHVSGSYTGRKVDKIAVLKELGFKFRKGKKIKVLMLEDAALNVECKLIKEIALGDHNLFVGEVLDASTSGKKPYAYYQRKNWILDKNVPRPSDEEREGIKKVIEKYLK